MIAMIKPTLNFVKCLQTWKMISARSMTSSIKPTLTMYTKEECSLCDEAKEILTPYFTHINFKEVDIMDPENEDYFLKYRFDIPVFHLNGNYLMKHRVDKDRLEMALSELNKWKPKN